MAYIIEVTNPFQITAEAAIKHFHPGGITILEWLKLQDPNFVEFQTPTICLLNGEPLMRKDWSKQIAENDVVNFISCPQGLFTIIAVVIIAVIALSIVMITNTGLPNTPGEAPASDPVFSNKGQQNTIRLGEPIEVCYGRNRIYPAVAARPYFKYIDNDQFQYSLFCLGQGEYEISAVQIADTLISSYQEAEYEIIPPGNQVTLFPTNVVTSVEAGGQTVLASNDLDYVPDGWIGPFPTNPATTQATQLEVDVVFPKGLYVLNSKGNVQSLSVSLEIQARRIDDLGVAIGDWLDLPSPTPFTVSAATTTPQRRTRGYTVSAGRYEVRMRRTDIKELSDRAGHDVVWEGLRAFIEVIPSFGNVTLLAVKIRATNNLNDQTQIEFNVLATRKLPIYSSGGLSEPVATRSIIWALVDAFRSQYGGRIFDEGFFDWDALQALDDIYTGRGDYFDWIFRDPITVWDAAKAIAMAGRAVPLLVGSLISMRRDGPLEIPVTLFSPDNIVAGSFQWDIKLWDLDEFDSIAIEYTEPATGYLQETVVAVLPGGTSENPEDVRLPGVQSRDQAYREGMYQLACLRYLREQITFDTGLEGHIPVFGDLIAVSHDVPKWGQAGYVVNAVRGAGDNYTLWVSEPLNWEESGEYVILFRGRKGETIGPLVVEQTSDSKQVLVSITDSSDFDFLLTGKTEPMLFLFGVSGRESKLCKVVKIEPQGGEVIRVTCVNNSTIIHSFDSLPTPILNQPSIPPIPPDLPTIQRLYITQVDGVLQIIQASWSAAFGAKYYIVQTSTDGENWQERANTTQTSIQMQVTPGNLWVRVSAVNNGQGPWKESDLVIGLLNVLDNYIPFDTFEWGVQWWQILNATGYLAKVYDVSHSDPILKHTFNLNQITRNLVYDYIQATADGNISRDMLVTVDPVFDDGPSGSPAELELRNPIPTPPGSPTSVLHSIESHGITYRLSWTVPHENDLIRVKVWLSHLNGFDPDIVLPVVDELVSEPGYAGIPTTTDVFVDYESPGGHPAIYWRVGLFDVWGNEISTNLSAQQVIAAHY